MNLKHMKLWTVAAFIDLLLGLFLIGCGIVEFTGIMKTNATTVIETGGIQLSYLVFISGVLVFACGLFALIDKKAMARINLQILLGAASLAWPVFVSIALFFSQRTICIRLLPTILSSLFFIIALMIVKITNESLKKVRKFNPKKHVDAMGKRRSNVNVASVFKGGSKRSRSVHKMHLSSGMEKMFRPKHRRMGGKLYSGSRKRGGIKLRTRYK